MAHKTTKTNTGVCACNQKEYSSWTSVFKQSSKGHAKLGELVCIKLNSQNCTDQNSAKYADKKIIFNKYMKVLCIHLKISYNFVLDKKHIWVAKHHFPWIAIIDDNMRYFRKPISKETVLKYKIGTMPDRRNIVTKTENRYEYFFVPNVAKEVVKKLADELVDGIHNDRAARAQSRWVTPGKTTFTENDQNMVSP